MIGGFFYERASLLNYPGQYLAMFLCLWAGLRLKDAGLLTWEQIDFAQSLKGNWINR
jgi:hypothetical protein